MAPALLKETEAQMTLARLLILACRVRGSYADLVGAFRGRCLKDRVDLGQQGILGAGDTEGSDRSLGPRSEFASSPGSWGRSARAGTSSRWHRRRCAS
jgi:hypothetical protein